MSVANTARSVRGRVLRRLWPLIRRWCDWRRQRHAPWPIVWECHGHRRGEHPVCDQCAGNHYHAWVAWPDAAKYGLAIGGPGVPVRCRICGGRKCDSPDCTARRHHRDLHNVGEGYFEPVGRLP